MLTSSSLLKKERGKKKRKLEVIDGEGDENDDVKTNRGVVVELVNWKQENRNEMESEVI